MKILEVAYYSILRNFRDKRSLFMCIAFPLIIIFIQGKALGSYYTEPKEFDKIIVCYISSNNTNEEKALNQFLNNKEIKNMIQIKKVSSYEEGIKIIKARNATSLIYLNNDKNSTKINLLNSKYSNFKSDIVKNIVDSFVDNYNSLHAISKIQKSSNPQFNRYENIENLSISSEGKTPRALDYYSVTMLVMILMYGTLYGNYAMTEDYYENTYIRIKSSTLKASENYLGKIISSIITVLSQALIIIFATKFIYKANWNGNMFIILLTCLLFAMLSTGMGAMFAIISQNGNISYKILSALVPLLTLFSGGFTPINYNSNLLNKLIYLSPNYLAHKILFNTIYEGSILEIQSCLLGMLAITILCFSVATIVGRRKLK